MSEFPAKKLIFFTILWRIFLRIFLIFQLVSSKMEPSRQLIKNLLLFEIRLNHDSKVTIININCEKIKLCQEQKNVLKMIIFALLVKIDRKLTVANKITWNLFL